jgi:hypothetical protein
MEKFINTQLKNFLSHFSFILLIRITRKKEKFLFTFCCGPKKGFNNNFFVCELAVEHFFIVPRIEEDTRMTL